MTGLLSAWLAEVVLIAYRSAKVGQGHANPIPGLALPSEYASTMIIFGALAFIPETGRPFATAVGWGLVAATFLNLWTPGKTAQQVNLSQKASNQGATRNIDTGAVQKGS